MAMLVEDVVYILVGLSALENNLLQAQPKSAFLLKKPGRNRHVVKRMQS